MLLRLLITPLAVLAASAAQRRFGPAVGGHVVALPLTTGPFLLLLGLRDGGPTVAHAAGGVVIGELSVLAFCAAYAVLAGRVDVRSALATSLLAALAAAAFAAEGKNVPVWAGAVLVSAGCVGFAANRRPPAVAAATSRPGRAWEVPVRMVLTTSVVATLLALSSVLGPALAGVLATLPVILSVMVPATHLADGPDAAAAVARGTLVTLPATTVGVTAVALTLVPYGPVVAAVAGLVTLVGTDVATSTLMSRLDAAPITLAA